MRKQPLHVLMQRIAGRFPLGRQSLVWACTLACLAPGYSAAAELDALIRDAANTDPSVLEARARQEQAQMQTERSRSGHWPVLGVSSTQKLTGSDVTTTTQFTGLTGKLNIFSAGAISAQVERDGFHEQFYTNKTDESRENIATTIGESYLGALRAKELLDAEKLNLKRHEKVINDLGIIVRHDLGRQHELVQAQARALQVRMRMVQYEKTMRLALNKLTRYTTLPVTLSDPFGKNWRQRVDVEAENARNPSILAQVNEMKATRAEMDNLRRSRWPAIDIVGNVGNTKGYGRTHAINAVVNWNFLDRGAYYSQQGAAKQLAAAESRIEMLKRETDERSHTAEVDMAQSELQSAASVEQIAASAKVVELYEMQFKVARRSLLELLNAYQELASVESGKVNADNDYRHAVLTYLTANAAMMGWVNANAGRNASATPGKPSFKAEGGSDQLDPNARQTDAAAPRILLQRGTPPGAE